MPIVERTKVFSLKIIKCYGWLKKQEEECQIMGRQLFKNATSIGANIRESRSALSDKDFLHKLEIALKETRKTQYWLELLIESELVNKNKFQPLLNEANEIGKILANLAEAPDRITSQSVWGFCQSRFIDTKHFNNKVICVKITA